MTDWCEPCSHAVVLFTKLLPCKCVDQYCSFRINHFDLIKNDVEFAFFRFAMNKVVLLHNAWQQRTSFLWCDTKSMWRIVRLYIIKMKMVMWCKHPQFIRDEMDVKIQRQNIRVFTLVVCKYIGKTNILLTKHKFTHTHLTSHIHASFTWMNLSKITYNILSLLVFLVRLIRKRGTKSTKIANKNFFLLFVTPFTSAGRLFGCIRWCECLHIYLFSCGCGGHISFIPWRQSIHTRTHSWGIANTDGIYVCRSGIIPNIARARVIYFTFTQNLCQKCAKIILGARDRSASIYWWVKHSDRIICAVREIRFWYGINWFIACLCMMDVNGNG